MEFPLSEAAIARLEAIVADHNGVPHEKICIDESVIQRDRQWSYLETAAILTGFDYLLQ